MLKEVLYELVQIPGPSGFEHRVANRLKELLEQHVDEARVDKMGNLIALKKGSEGKHSLMLVAHTDQVSLVVESVDKYVRFRKMGCITPKVLPGTPVLVVTQDGDVPGVVCSPAPQLLTEEPELWIDVGDRGKFVSVGDLIVFSTSPMWLNDQRTLLAAPAVDDRAGCAVLTQLAQRLSNKTYRHNIYFVGTAQEEIGGFGLRHVLKSIIPDWLIAVDVGHTTDYDGTTGEIVGLRTGLFMIKFMFAQPPQEGGLYPGVVYFSSPRTNKLLVKAAEKLDIHLHAVGYFHFADPSIAYAEHPEIDSSFLAIPRRYGHSPYEVIDVETAGWLVEVLAQAIDDLDGWERDTGNDIAGRGGDA